MKSIYRSDRYPIDPNGLNIKALLRQAILITVAEHEYYREPLLALLNHVTEHVARFPVITASLIGLRYQTSVIHYVRNDVVRFNCVLHICMPDKSSQLLWMPWPAHLAQPQRDPGQFHPTYSRGFPVLQARATKCYDHAYAYSGQTHPLEKETPPEITGLYREVNAMFGLVDAVNMCLENDYTTGRHWISEHSDDERAFNHKVRDVFCFVAGPASREAVFRERKTSNGKPAREREVLRICLPAGMYVMHGAIFQKSYSHEFPKLHDALFTRLCAKSIKLLEGFPVKVGPHASGAPQKGLIQAAWLQQHKEEVLAAIDKGLYNKKRGDTAKKDHKAFEEWCLWRTSYTLRSFRVGTESARKRIKF